METLTQPGPTLSQQHLLDGFTRETLQLLEQDTTAPGKMLYGHIRRQVDLIDSERYGHWFAETGEQLGFHWSIARAGIAASDVTKVSQASEIAREHFGTTGHHITTLAQRGDLLYGRVFTPFTPLEDLYMHSEAGRHYAHAELARRGDDELGRQVGEAVVGHDSFNSGFGQHMLKKILAAKYHEDPLAFGYPVSLSPSGFLVQVLDRLEGCDPHTMMRYVSEGVNLRREPITHAIQVGLIDNYTYLLEAYDQIKQDAERTLHPAQSQAFLTSEAICDFVTGLEHIPGILALLVRAPGEQGEGPYRLKCGNDWVLLDSLEVFCDRFLQAVELAGKP